MDYVKSFALALLTLLGVVLVIALVCISKGIFGLVILFGLIWAGIHQIRKE